MKKFFMTLAAVVCCAFTSCVSNDNPVETAEDNIPLAEAIKLHTAPQSFYKLDTKEVLPIYVVVDNSYEVDGQKRYYNLSNITEVSTDGSMFTVDASRMAKNGYIKLIPNVESNSFKDVVELFEDYGALKWTGEYSITLKNKKGETFGKNVEVTYLSKNEFNLKETCKVSELDEDDNYIVKATQPYGLFDWSLKRYADKEEVELNNFFFAKLNEKDGYLYVMTDGAPTDEGDPNTLVYTFKRYLTGSPNPELPEDDGLMVNFRIKLELEVTE